ncbi:hypothetical protein ACFFMN_23640 [Planobispora siamensis]|uniref:Uncharacterized protein n=1 Tax=Planobispora siamensis TaxID=936338 RepID=A0A8J3WMU8_9ACTN|nr:hypothetical protein [Planobispora siamensis]GIH95358.1 hypothetical protein Psi01_59880 [Planobispora siamensis]
MQVPHMYDALSRGIDAARAQPWRPWRRRIAIWLTVAQVTLGEESWARTWKAVRTTPAPPLAYGYTIRQARQMQAVLAQAMSGYHARVGDLIAGHANDIDRTTT